jgi:hypothetical protein
MKTFITEVRCVDAVYSGPRVQAASFKEAQEILNRNRMGYAKVIGELMFEIHYSQN